MSIGSDADSAVQKHTTGRFGRLRVVNPLTLP